MFSRNRRKSKANYNTKQPFGSTNLSLEPLESRIVLSINPVLTVSGDLTSDEGSVLNITDIGVFSDEVVGGGGGSIGLNPDDYTSLGAFNPTADVVFDTDALEINGMAVGATTVSLDTGNGAYDAAVFTFDSFELDAGLTLTGTGSLPLVILSQSDLDVFGTIDVSATAESGSNITGGQRIAGPGGGDGGKATSSPIVLDGSAAAGAPVVLGFQGFGRGFGTGIRGGGGGGFGGDGGEGILSTATKKGNAYGDLSLGIQGGSGGGAIGVGSNRVDGGGGGGGIELGANGTITVSGSVLAVGGVSGASTTISGGGGAGGGILLHAFNVDVSGGTLNANGGSSDARPDTTVFGSEGGAGAGGRILIAHNSTGTFTDTGSTITVEAGLDGGVLPETVGEAGVFGVVPVTPTPVIETYDFVINWGDGTPEDTGVPTLDVVGSPGIVNEGSFDGSHTYADDGVYTVTVTVNDSGGGTATDIFEVTVNNVAPIIVSLSTDSSSIGDLGEGDTVTLTANFTDEGILDTHTATIDWGDGTTSVGTIAAGVVTADHVYANGGIFEVTLTLADNDGDSDIETTTTVIAGVGLNNGFLQAIGTNENDFVKVYKSYYSGNLKVLSYIGDGPLQWDSFNASSVDEIEIILGGGHDLGFVSRRVHVDATLDGGDGDDLLFGGSGNDVILGGDGYDVLIGRSGRDLMMGGAGSDFILGDRGQDILVAGTTAFDNDSAALDAVMAEWTSSRDYATRVENITNTGSGIDFDDRLNGEFFLVTDGEDATVFDDEAADLLIGGRGLDLYFANLEGGVEDHIFGLRSGEILEELEEVDV